MIVVSWHRITFIGIALLSCRKNLFSWSFPIVHPNQNSASKTFAASTTSSTSATSSALAVSFSSHAAEDGPDMNHPNRRTEFEDLEAIPESSQRQARRKEDAANRLRFVQYGDDLWSLRKNMNSLSRKLIKAINNGSDDVENEIRDKLREVEQQDPELVYKLELERLREATSEGRIIDAEQHSRDALAARSCLPHFNLDGLWVGKYGHHGYEMVNITYQGDTLVAYKVTGDKNVPRGEITFQVDLSPIRPRSVGLGATAYGRGGGGGGTTGNNQAPLQPINLTEKAAKKWGTSQLPRYRGLGQVAEAGFTNNQWMDGQLIIIGEEYFSFAWVPIEQQIFFGRPSPELALKMLRESNAAVAMGTKIWEAPPSMDDDVKVLKDYVTSCLEKTTETVEEDLEGDPFSCIWHGMDTEECYFQ